MYDQYSPYEQYLHYKDKKSAYLYSTLNGGDDDDGT
jgi:hypothetical protein